MNRWQLPVLLLVPFLVFVNTLFYPFVHDDIVFIVQNPAISHLNDWLQVFLPALQPAPAGANAYWRPLLEIIYRLEYSVFGFNPMGWHLFNVLIHLANGLLLWRLLSTLKFASNIAWTVAVLFLIHPLQSEAVACVAGVSNLVMAFFVLCTLILYLNGRWFLGVFAFVLAMLAKEQALMVLPLLGLIDWYRGRRPWMLWGIFIALALSFLSVRHSLTGANILADIISSPGELRLRLLAIAQVLCADVRLIFLPVDLHYYRSTNILTASLWWWLPVFIAIAVCIKADRVVRLGVCWFVLALLPVLNIVPLINEYSLILTAEHFLYLPMIGILVVVVVYGNKVLKQNGKWVLFFLLIGLSLITIRQNMFWRSEVALFERTIEFEPDFGRGHLLLAKAYYFQRRYSEANIHFERAYAIMSLYASKAVGDTPQRFYTGFMKGILFDWAHSLQDLGLLEKAVDKYQQAIAIDPLDGVLWNNLGALYMQMNNTVKAKESFQKAILVSPNFLPAKRNLDQF